MMAPIYHPTMKIIRPVRKKLKVKIMFNVLGPMLNPARIPYAVVGVYAKDLVSIYLYDISLHLYEVHHCIVCCIDDIIVFNVFDGVISSTVHISYVSTW